MSQHPYLQRLFAPERVMNARWLGAMQPHRLSAARSLLNKMIREQWRIQLDSIDVDARGRGSARYTITTPTATLTFAAWLFEPHGAGRTGRIIGTAWDMMGTLIDGTASEAQLAQSARELPKLYEGRAPVGTLIWMRSNQSLRLFRHVRDSLAAGRQPDAAFVQRVGYLMRNTGLDGNGTFGTRAFASLSEGHPLQTSYHAQLLAAYLMRELSVDLVEALARIDAPQRAVRLAAEVRQHLGVGNGSALGLAMFVYNRPVLVNAYLSAYIAAASHVLALPITAADPRLATLEQLLSETIRYRAFDRTRTRMFAGGKAIAGDLTRIRTTLRAAMRGEIHPLPTETLLAAVHRIACPQLCPEATHSFNTLLIELAPEHADRQAAGALRFDEQLRADPSTPAWQLRDRINTSFRWAMQLPLNHGEQRDRVWYQARTAEEPRSGPADEVPGAHELLPNYPDQVRELRHVLRDAAPDTPIGRILATHPHLDQVTHAVCTLADLPYAIPHADPHDIDFVPVWLIRFVNGFIHGLDRTEDYLHRDVLGIIYHGAPFRDEIAGQPMTRWWWRHRSALRVPPSALARPAMSPAGTVPGSQQFTPPLNPVQSPTTAPAHLVAGATAEQPDHPLTVQVRELRLAAGRALQALQVPSGVWQRAREFVVTAVTADTRALRSFGQLLAAQPNDLGEKSLWRAPTIGYARDQIDVDGHGASLLLIGQTLVAAIGAVATESGIRVLIRRCAASHAVAGLSLALAEHGVSLVCAPSDTAAASPDASTEITALAVRPVDGAALQSRYRAARHTMLHHGSTVPAHWWWNVYYPGNAGLYPDTELSRQHTGSVHDTYRPGQPLTRLFDLEEVATLIDPNRDTDTLPQPLDLTTAAAPGSASAPADRSQP